VRRWMKGGALVALALLLVVSASRLPIVEWAGLLVDWMRGAGATGAAAFAVVYVVAAVLMVPGSVLTAGAGLAYGPWWGIALVSPVSVLAATVAFILGRTAARGWIAKRTDADPRFRAVDAAIGRHGFKIVTLLRLSPVFPFNVLNYALGLTGVRLRDYVLGSFIGMLPGTFLYIYIGSLVGDLAALTHGDATASAARQALSLIGLAATVIVTVYVTRVARQALADELSRSNPVAPAPQV
jgi:uncharacterized membrane protein YdjX (TVP38/TMEM64 family)